MTLFDLRLQELHNQLSKKELSVTDLVGEAFTRIKEHDERVGAYLTLNEEGARAEAARLDNKLGSDEAKGLLFGLPVGIKDNMVTEGLRTTCASQFLSNYNPIYDATVVTKLKQAEAVTIGKLNMDEFAMGGSNENSSFHPVRNPWDLTRVPGGSSGGSAAAVAAGEAYFTLGSDTGGSIRQPASYCGVVGLKPTYGLVSRYGLVAFASSLDQIGPITKNVEDAAYVLQAISGHDAKDSTSANVDIPDYVSALSGEISGLKIAVPKEYLDGIDPQVKASVLEALRVLEGLGAEWEEVSLPHT
ncbi:MAG TPA: amidase family protein, partial [Paenibacillus sp.]